MGRSTPEVSFVVIAYNEATRVWRCLDSIRRQDAAVSWELVFVDDGSTDATPEIVKAVAARDERIRLVRLPVNQGRGAARAAGIARALAPRIALIDSDIELPVEWLRRCLEELPGNAAVSGIPVPDGDAAVVSRLSRATPRVVAGQVPITGSNVLFEANILRGASFDPRDRIGEDFRLAHRLMRAGLRLHRVPGLIVRHEEARTYVGAIKWRFANALDASTHPRELGRLRMADLVWGGWLGISLATAAAAILAGPAWLLIAAIATAAPGVLHAATRFHPRPLGRFVIACFLDIPLLAAYLVGRTVGIPRLLRGRS